MSLIDVGVSTNQLYHVATKNVWNGEKKRALYLQNYCRLNSGALYIRFEMSPEEQVAAQMSLNLATSSKQPVDCIDIRLFLRETSVFKQAAKQRNFKPEFSGCSSFA